MIRMIVFDMAGTVVNEHNLVYNVLQEAINENGFHFTLNEVLAVGAGQEKLAAINSVLALRGIQNRELAESIFNLFMSKLEIAYSSRDITEQKDASRMFRILKQKGILVVLNTGYDRHTAEALLEKLGWTIDEHIDDLISASDVQNSRPAPDMIHLAMKRHGINNESEVMKIGDSIIDIQEGRNAGCRFSIGITTGAHTASQLESARPDFVLQNLMELLPILEADGLRQKSAETP